MNFVHFDDIESLNLYKKMVICHITSASLLVDISHILMQPGGYPIWECRYIRMFIHILKVFYALKWSKAQKRRENTDLIDLDIIWIIIAIVI